MYLYLNFLLMKKAFKEERTFREKKCPKTAAEPIRFAEAIESDKCDRVYSLVKMNRR